MNTNLEHLSYSSVSTYLMCGKYWEFKYVRKEHRPASIAMVFGSAIHKTIEQTITEKIRPIERWSSTWEKQLEEEKSIDWGAETPEGIYNEGIRLLSDKEIEKTIMGLSALAIEKYVELKIAGVPIPVIGYIDIITQDGIPGDFKTSNKSWSEDRASGEMQPLFYLAALSQAGTPVVNGRFRHYVFVKTKQPKVQIIEHEHNLREMFFLFSLIQNVWKGIEAGVFPENPGGWKCSPAYCEYWDICRGRYQ